jgi:hypothetical protein
VLATIAHGWESRPQPATTAYVPRPEIGLVAERNRQAITRIEWARPGPPSRNLGALAPGLLGQIAALVRTTACAARTTHSHMDPLFHLMPSCGVWWQRPVVSEVAGVLRELGAWPPRSSASSIRLDLTCGAAGCVAKETLVDFLTALPPAL